MSDDRRAAEPNPTPPMVSVCVCLDRAPERLGQLLAGLALQTYRPPCFEVVIVGHDGCGDLLAPVTAARRLASNLTIRCATNPATNAAQARNVAVAMSRGAWVAFIDSEYDASADWLEALLGGATATSAPIVLGPKIAVYPPDTAPWVLRSEFFEKHRFQTGELVSSDYGRTSNALVTMAWLKARSDSPFDTEPERQGLEGHDFFHWAERTGARIVWCDEAVVSMVVPRSRHTLRYMLTRSLRSSTMYWRDINRHRSRLRSWQEGLSGIAAACVLAAVGALLLPCGKHVAFPIWVRAAKGVARALALTDIAVAEH